MKRGLHAVAQLVEALCYKPEGRGLLLIVVGPAGPTTTNSTAITKLRR
jgi:hypothetical protein